MTSEVLTLSSHIPSNQETVGCNLKPKGTVGYQADLKFPTVMQASKEARKGV